MNQSASLRRNTAIVKSVPYRRPRISAAGMMSVRHYKRRVSGDDMGIAGCGCRGCLAWMEKMRIDQAADALIEAEGCRA